MVNTRLLVEGYDYGGYKGNILMTALRLFAREGYEAVSVSTVAWASLV